MTKDKKPFEDEELSNLHAEQILLAFKIKKRKKEIAKKNNDIVDSLDKLVCENHPNTTFEVIGTIPDSYIYTLSERNKEGLDIYRCKSCGEDEKLYLKTKAYECSFCGIVTGDFKTIPYRSSKESWRALAGREGEHHHCRICETQLGSKYWGYS